MSAVPQEVIPPRRLDLGCGKNKKEGFIGVDSIKFDGVDFVFDLARPANAYIQPCRGGWSHVWDAEGCRNCGTPSPSPPKWPWEDESVDEVHCSHMIEHLDPAERIHFANELYRVLKKGAKAQIITPHFASVRAYGDLTHKWPPVVSFWYLYLNAEWRKANAPHNDEYTCDFDHGYGFGLHPSVQARNQDYQNYAVIHLLEGAQDLHVTLTKR